MSTSLKNWYAVHTKPGFEKRVASLFSRKDIENYCPLKRDWNGKKQIIIEPLFNGYIFVKIKDTELKKIRITDGVINFVYWLGLPVVIKEEEIEIMKRFMNEYMNVKLKKVPFDINRSLKMVQDNFEKNSSSMVAVKNNNVQIVLPSIGYMMIAEVQKSANYSMPLIEIF